MFIQMDKHNLDLAPGAVERAHGCLVGQLAGDALSSLVEFRSLKDNSRDYPNGVRWLHDGGTWGTISGQPTDDSGLALGNGRRNCGSAARRPPAISGCAIPGRPLIGQWLPLLLAAPLLALMGGEDLAVSHS